ncbi:hypothetical protein ACTI_37740 [Actinoplanes sp. OR16]|uniref:hypothetical protein n=1 Tax=Actinoplanes sp. OR16 TaxID=946334 RepID=UPI000F6D8B82|nr:hypothetical protein [Actinoplanes sp. OR16]BBH67089.1 hypothetical protein ACTI_37740 [Actinoplanes sp. OR16]
MTRYAPPPVCMGCRRQVRRISLMTYLCDGCTRVFWGQCRRRYPAHRPRRLRRWCGGCDRLVWRWQWQEHTHLCDFCTRNICARNRRWVRLQERRF